MDLSELQGLLAQFQPTEQDKQAARQQALMAMGLGLLGARRGQEFDRIGQAGLLGMNAYHGGLNDIVKERQANLGQAATLSEFLRKQGLLDAANKMLVDEPQAQQGNIAPQAGISPRTAAQFGPGGGDTVGFSPMPPAPMQVPQGTLPQSVSNYQGPNWRQQMPKEVRAMLAAGGDPKAIADAIEKFGGTKIGPDGTVIAFNGQPLYRQTAAGIQYYNPNGTPGQFVAYGKEAIGAEAERSGAIKGAETAATIPYQMGKYDIGGSQQIDLPQNVILSLQKSGLPANQRNWIAQNVPADQVETVVKAAQSGKPFDINVGQGGSGGAPVPQQQSYGGGAGGGVSSPLAQKEAESRIATQAAQNTEVATNFGKDYVDLVKAEKQAPATIQKYQYLKGMWSNVETGKLAPTVQSLKSLAAFVAPDLAKEWTKDTPYFQAAQALSNAMALELRNPAGGAGMPGSLSDADRQYLQSMISSAQNDPRSIPMILDAKIALEKRNQDLGRIARDYRARNGGVIDEGLYQAFQKYSDANPLFKQQAPAQAPQGGGKVVDFSTLPRK